MTAIVAAFREWEYMMRSVEEQITVYTDHKNLKYFNTTKILNRRQHRWAEFLQSFNFKVVYRERRLNEKADALCRRRDYSPEVGSNSDPCTFSVRINMLVRSGTSCDHRCCNPAKGFGYSPRLGWRYSKQPTKTMATWIRSSRY